jgi:Holliday junction resolvase RusA-like endonuclease
LTIRQPCPLARREAIRPPNPAILDAIGIPKAIRFFVPGKPEPGGSKRAFIVGKRAVVVDDCKKSRPWKTQVSSVADEVYRGPLLDVPLSVEFTFIVQRPKGHFGTGKNASALKPGAPKYPAIKPDVLKFARSTEDALTGILWRDDCLTVDLIAKKRYGDRPGVWVSVAVKDA